MGLDARVLIVARDDTLARALAAGLDRSGWRSITARGVHSAMLALEDFPIEAVIIVTAPGHEPDARAVAGRLKAARAPQRLPILALGRPNGEPVDKEAFDLVLAPPLDPIQAGHRLDQLVRAAIAEEEMELRLQTFADRGRRLECVQPDPSPLRVLTIGEPAPRFLGLSHALKLKGVEVVAAFTAYTSFDYMHDRGFDAVVLWGGANPSEALSIIVGMRRNSHLYHLPTLLYLGSSTEVDLADAFRRGVSDVAAADTPEFETAMRAVALAEGYRREIAIREALERVRGSGLMDAPTGLFTRELFAAHLARLAGAQRGGRRPLSVAVLKVADRPELARVRRCGWLERALPQIGSMVRRLVRAEDTAARLADDVFALALPGARAAAAKTAAERIAAVIACTAFQAGEGEAAFTVEFEIGSAELQTGETVAHAFERAAASGPVLRAG